MTDAYQNVAGLVARLRANPHGSLHINTRAGINEPTSMIKEAADRLESLSQALREAETDKAALAAMVAESMKHLHAIARISERCGDEITAARAFIAEKGGKDG